MGLTYQQNMSFPKDLGEAVDRYKTDHPAKFSGLVQRLLRPELIKMGYLAAQKK